MTYTGTKEELAAIFDELSSTALSAMDRATNQAARMRAKGEWLAYSEAARIVRVWKETKPEVQL